MKVIKGKGQLTKIQARMTMTMTSEDKVEVAMAVAMEVVRKVGAEEQKTSTHQYKERLVLPINLAG